MRRASGLIPASQFRARPTQPFLENNRFHHGCFRVVKSLTSLSRTLIRSVAMPSCAARAKFFSWSSLIMSMTWLGVWLGVWLWVLSTGSRLIRSGGSSKMWYSWPKGPATNSAWILPDLMNRLTVLDDTPSDLAACAMVKPCVDIGIDKCIAKEGFCQGAGSNCKQFCNCLMPVNTYSIYGSNSSSCKTISLSPAPICTV